MVVHQQQYGGRPITFSDRKTTWENLLQPSDEPILDEESTFIKKISYENAPEDDRNKAAWTMLENAARKEGIVCPLSDISVRPALPRRKDAVEFYKEVCGKLFSPETYPPIAGVDIFSAGRVEEKKWPKPTREGVTLFEWSSWILLMSHDEDGRAKRMPGAAEGRQSPAQSEDTTAGHAVEPPADLLVEGSALSEAGPSELAVKDLPSCQWVGWVREAHLERLRGDDNLQDYDTSSTQSMTLTPTDLPRKADLSEPVTQRVEVCGTFTRSPEDAESERPKSFIGHIRFWLRM